MRRCVAALPLVVLLAPCAARGADVGTDRTCYLDTDHTTVTISGSGYTPAAPYTVTLNGTALGGGPGVMDAGGAMHGAFAPPALAKDELERLFEVGVKSGALAATTQFTVTRVLARVSATRGDPATLKVRFMVNGFGLGAPNPDVYLHYVTPAGRLSQTLRLGKTQGQCGTLRTRRRMLFPFSNPQHGVWKLQFDTSKAYRRGTTKSQFLFFTIKYNVHARRD
jgi:hypothetical protein